MPLTSVQCDPTLAQPAKKALGEARVAGEFLNATNKPSALANLKRGGVEWAN